MRMRAAIFRKAREPLVIDGAGVGRARARLTAGDLLVVASVLAVKGLLLGLYGLYAWSDNDGRGYVALAEELRHLETWISVPDLHTNFQPLSIFRLPTYSLLILTAELIAGKLWQPAIVGIQLFTSTAATLVLHRTIVRTTGVWAIGLGAALVFSFSYQGYFERFVLTDSLYASLAMLLVCRLVCLAIDRRPPTRAETLALSLMLGAMMSLRETNLFFAIGLAPLVLIVVSAPGRRAGRLRHVLVFYAPAASVVAAVMLWNTVRVGEPVFTTGAQTGVLFTLIKIEQAGTPVFDNDTPLGRAAQRHLHDFEFSEVLAICQDLFKNDGMTSVAQARLVSAQYLRAWVRYPRALLEYVDRNLFEFRFALLSPFLYDWLSGRPRNWYSLATQDLTLFAAYGLPLLALIPCLAVQASRRHWMLMAALDFLLWVVLFCVAAIHVERRYFLPLAAPIMLILCLALPATRLVFSHAVSRIRRGRGRGAGNRRTSHGAADAGTPQLGAPPERYPPPSPNL